LLSKHYGLKNAALATAALGEKGKKKSDFKLIHIPIYISLESQIAHLNLP
jgi:hypothetical protein